MSWDNFLIFAATAIALWLNGAVFALMSRRKTAIILTILGLCVYATFIAEFWASLGRPPLRTTGETRLWYSFFMMLSALLTYIRWDYKWIPTFSLVVASVFICLNIFKPEIHDESLMPALQSWWFVPHVTVYIFSYSVLGCAFILACAGLIKKSDTFLEPADQLVYIGLAFLSLGMLSGALWAKQAWGNYWNWDPKETWAAVTWCIYLIYIHLRLIWRRPSAVTPLEQQTQESLNPALHDVVSKHRKLLYVILIAGFLVLQMCWWGVNYLPSSQGSQHVYATN